MTLAFDKHALAKLLDKPKTRCACHPPAQSILTPLVTIGLYRFLSLLRVRVFVFSNEMLPPTPHEVAVPSGEPQPHCGAGKDSKVKASGSSNGGGRGLKRDRQVGGGGKDSAKAPAEDDENAGMFANMFETAVGMAAEMAEQQLGLEGEDDGEESAEGEGEGEEHAAGEEGAESIGSGDGSSDETDAL